MTKTSKLQLDNQHTVSELRNTYIPVTNPDAGLRMTEIFYSLQGEALTSGLPTVFVRLTGCPLRCVYCDTTYSFTGGGRQSIDDIVSDIGSYPCMRVCITGGEPLAQPNCIALIKRLLNDGYDISLETAGALSIAEVPNEVSTVMDIKTPSSGEVQKNLWSNLDYLTQHDQLKFVIMNREDYEWSKHKVQDLQLDKKVSTVWFSPMFNINDELNDNTTTPDSDNGSQVPYLARQLAEWILEDALPVRLQLQLHKLIWADAKGK